MLYGMDDAFQKSHPRIYDQIGKGYAGRRVPDPRIAARIWRALGSEEMDYGYRLLVSRAS